MNENTRSNNVKCLHHRYKAAEEGLLSSFLEAFLAIDKTQYDRSPVCRLALVGEWVLILSTCLAWIYYFVCLTLLQFSFM